MKPVVKLNNFVRKHTQAIELETLNRQGLTRVNFLTLKKINELVSLAVQAAFKKYQRTLSQRDVRSIEDEARARVEEELASLPPSAALGTAASPLAAASPAAAGVPATGASPPAAGAAGSTNGTSADDEARRAEIQRERLTAEMLERRLEKVRRRLHEMEETVRQLAEAKGVDPGLPSLFRKVEGLSPLDGQFEKKREMLKVIFEDNLELQKGVRQEVQG